MGKIERLLKWTGCWAPTKSLLSLFYLAELLTEPKGVQMDRHESLTMFHHDLKELDDHLWARLY